jgi:hypothetical protein
VSHYCAEPVQVFSAKRLHGKKAGKEEEKVRKKGVGMVFYYALPAESAFPFGGKNRSPNRTKVIGQY